MRQKHPRVMVVNRGSERSYFLASKFFENKPITDRCEGNADDVVTPISLDGRINWHCRRGIDACRYVCRTVRLDREYETRRL